jgi:hypothetical protein
MRSANAADVDDDDTGVWEVRGWCEGRYSAMTYQGSSPPRHGCARIETAMEAGVARGPVCGSGGMMMVRDDDAPVDVALGVCAPLRLCGALRHTGCELQRNCLLGSVGDERRVCTHRCLMGCTIHTRAGSVVSNPIEF